MGEEIIDRLKIYAELGPLPSLSIHPDMPGYTTGRLFADAREAIAEIARLRKALNWIANAPQVLDCVTDLAVMMQQKARVALKETPDA